ncbi:MAG: protein-disulfide reductase DsbD family protein [Filomicrobium sp.]
MTLQNARQVLALAVLLILAVGLGSISMAPAASAEPGMLRSDWIKGHASRVRLVAGRMDDGKAQFSANGLVAGVEIELDNGWKTYWQNPGEAGGVPPVFDFGKSQNLAEAKVLYPAPKRLKDKMGDSIGYKYHVVFPVLVTPKNASEPVDLKVDFAFGVCADICIPAEASMQLKVPTDMSRKMPRAIAAALDYVPRAFKSADKGGPKLLAFTAEFSGKTPNVVLDVSFPGGAEDGDVFAIAPDGIYFPMPKRVKGPDDAADVARFHVDLREAFDLEELKGKTISLTMVGADGQSKTDVILQ